MTKKDYKLLAHFLAAKMPEQREDVGDNYVSQEEGGYIQGYDAAVRQVLAALIEDNGERDNGFDGPRFLMACHNYVPPKGGSDAST